MRFFHIKFHAYPSRFTHRYEQFAYANVHRLLAFDRGHHVVSMNIAVCKCIPLELALFLCHRYFLFLPRHLILLAPNLSQFFNLGNAVLILVIQDKSEINDCSNFTSSKVNEISYDNSGYCTIFGIRNIFLVYSGRLITNSSKISCFIYETNETSIIITLFWLISIFWVSKNYRILRHIDLFCPSRYF